MKFRSTLRSLVVLATLAATVVACGKKDETPLAPEDAFRFSAQRRADGAIEVRYRIADGYYMYRDKFHFAAEPKSVRLGEAQLPAGKLKHDPNFGDVEVYRNEVAVVIPVVAGGGGTLKLKAIAQGCWDGGLCYPPQDYVADLGPVASASPLQSMLGTSAAQPLQSVPAASDATGGVPSPADVFTERAPAAHPAVVSDESRFAGILEAGSLWKIVAFFFGAGLLLTFTPCVLPMVPILSGIIVGEGREATKMRAFALSIAYVLGMAVTYTLIGVAAAYSGQLLSSALQNPWVLGTFATIFVALAFSMFGFYDIQLPSGLHTRLTAASNRFSGGHIGAVVLMGVLSAAIVSPCVAAPLAGALLYISQTRDVMLGATGLFAMALGMGVPLVIVGVTEGAVLPRSGHFMRGVKKFFGFLLLGLAIWIVAPVIPAVAQMLAWAALLIVGAMYLHALDPLPHDAPGYARFWKGVGVLALVSGIALVIGALAGGRDPLQPLSGMRTATAATASQPSASFERVTSLADLDARIAAAGRPVMLDFYADWCVSCKEMERFTFSDARVQAKLGNFLMLQADVTANSDDDKALLKRFRLFGPPGIVFFDRDGREIPGLRVIGYQGPDRFLQTLALARGM